MKVSQIIEILQAKYSPDDSVVVAWWDKQAFSAAHGMEPDEWAAAAEYLDDIDWSRVHDDLSSQLDYWIER